MSASKNWGGLIKEGGMGMSGTSISLSAANPEGNPELVISDTPLIWLQI